MVQVSHLEINREWKLGEQDQVSSAKPPFCKDLCSDADEECVWMEAFLAPGPLGARSGDVTDRSCSNDPIRVMRSVRCPAFFFLRDILFPTP